MSVDYTYLVDDTANDLVNLGKLQDEIVALGAAPTLLGIVVTGPVDNPTSGVRVSYDGTLSVPEKTALDGAIAAHDGATAAQGFIVVTRDGKRIEATGFSAGAITWVEI